MSDKFIPMNNQSNLGWKVILVVVVIAVLVGAFLYMRSGVTLSPGVPDTETTPISSVDDVEGALLKDAEEEAILLDESSDAELLGSDSEALENVGKSYDEQTL